MSSGRVALVCAALASAAAGCWQMVRSQAGGQVPIEVVRTLLQAYEAKEWSRAAELVDDTALAQFREMQLAMAQGWEERPSIVQQGDSTIPPAVAEYFDSIHAQTVSRHGNPLLHFFAGVSTLSELRALPPAELLARWMEGNDPKPENYDDNRPPLFTREVLGAVTEGDSLVHVVYRIHTDTGQMGQTQETEVLTVRRSGQRWRALLNRDIGHWSGAEITSAPPEPR